ncbi:GDSL esterase/lipase At5g03610 [Brachypodium distachyon]|nr:GDSL esterase/lipase At5g03610 [Brachypodium distachyon]|eukprot:XP_014751207.1 GDSL esterase/lipase At5g03610 [Brachypodium distachyon]
MNNHTSCDERGNSIASIHNKRLEEKLSHLGKSVLILDLNSAFNAVIADTTDSPVAEPFTSKLTPCCEPSDPNGLCGDRDDDEDGMFAYTLDTDNVQSYFYWDEMNPTHAGWEAVMSQLEYSIKDFLGIRVG